LQVSLIEQHAAPLAAAFRAARMAFHRESPAVYPFDRGAARARAGAVGPRRRRAGATPLPWYARLVALAFAAVALACDPYVQGNGIYLEVERTPGPFAGVHVDDAIAATVVVSVGAAHTVRVSGDANILDYVKTQVRPVDVRGDSVDVLHVWVEEPSGGYAPTIPIRAVVQLPALRYLGTREAAHLEARDVAAPDLDLEAGGGSDVEVKGPGGTTLHASLGDASADLGSWSVQDAVVTLTGRSSLELVATGTVTGEAHGTSAVNNLVAGATCDVSLFDAARLACGPPPH
jgi:hypothetical protein